jgi:hypothetical protein
MGAAVLIWLSIASLGVAFFWLAQRQHTPPTIEKNGKRSKYLVMSDEAEYEMDALVRSALSESRKHKPKKLPVVEETKVVGSSTAQSEPAEPVNSHSKDNSERNCAIVFFVFVAFVVAGYWIYSYFNSENSRAVMSERNGTITFYEIENGDRAISTPDMDLTLSDVNHTINYIKKQYPQFNMQEQGLSTNDTLNQQWIDVFNTNPSAMELYVSGSVSDAGKSSLFAMVYVDEEGKWEYAEFMRDYEFSDSSGFTYTARYNHSTSEKDLVLAAPEREESYDGFACLVQMKGEDDQWYWSVAWSDETAENTAVSEGAVAEFDTAAIANSRRALLVYFLNRFHETIAYSQLDTDFLLDVHTGLAESELVRDIVDWGQTPELEEAA